MSELNKRTEYIRRKRKAARTECVIQNNEKRFNAGDFNKPQISFDEMLTRVMKVGKLTKPK